MKKNLSFLLFLVTLCVFASGVSAQNLLISDFKPDGLKWFSSMGNPNPLTYVPEGLKTNVCATDTDGIERLCIDAKVNLDLSAWSQFVLKASVSNPKAFASTSLYFHSKNGWYSGGNALPGKDGTLRFRKADFRTEENPVGWDQIDTIRISFWRMGKKDSEALFQSLECVAESVVFVSILNSEGIELWIGKNNASILSRQLAAIGIESDRTIMAKNATEAEWLALLKNRQACFINHTAHLLPETRALLEKWAQENHTVVHFLSTDLRDEPIELEPLMNILAKAPKLEESIKTQALTHLETVFGEKVPEAAELHEKAQKIFDSEGLIAVWKFCQETHEKNLHRAAQDLKIADSFEFRGWWNHSGLGAYPGDWERTAKELKAAGFNAVVPNMLWVGEALFPSQYVPTSENYEKYGDQLKQCLDACHAEGIQVHIWRVCWKADWHISPERQKELEKAGRLQKTPQGETRNWLCPSNPENAALEINTMMELADKYPVDGVHFDYIRYNGMESCYCDGCRAHFEKTIGKKVENWPADVRHNGPLHKEFVDWRASLITHVVKTVHDQMKVKHPNVKISAAVFNGYPSCREHNGQDWVLWANEGWVDFLCPMNYTLNAESFENMSTNQLSFVKKDFPLYFGIGEWKLTPDGTIEQIKCAKELGAKGFTIFDLSERAVQHVCPPLTE
ncbi:MAG: family 10 glycosylhydrolase [Thermoguttaceae bacterium]|nr:family 10 glycosylhydrolase [Thermoguttaceae bacterium]